MTKKINTTELVIRLTGEISESNFNIFKEEQLIAIKAADKPLITDQDFVDAEQVVKNCKKAEEAIKEAKTEALSQTVDIEKLFSSMDEISDTLRTTRLSLDKKVKKEKANRKKKIVTSGGDELQTELNNVMAKLPEIAYVFRVNISLFESAVVGKKKLDSMENAVNEVLETELDSLHATKDRIVTILRKIRLAEKENPGLFPDVNSLLEKELPEISALIDGRVAKFKLAEKEKAEREEKARIAKEQADAETKRLAEEKAKEESPVKEVVSDDKPQHFTPEAEAKSQEMPPVETPSVTRDIEEQLGNFVITIKVSCVPIEAKKLAIHINNITRDNDSVTNIKLSRI